VRRYWRLVAVGLALGVAVAGLAAAASASSSKAQAAATGSRAQACGDIPNIPPNDPNNLLPGLKLSKGQQHDFTGLKFPIQKSAWANWKPSHAAPYKVAVVWSQPANGFNNYSYNLVQKFLKRAPAVGTVTATQASSATAITDQLQQYNAAVQQKPDLIVFAPLSPTAATADIEAAGKQGIPTVVIYNFVDSPYAFSTSSNPYIDGTMTASALVKALGGQGNVLQVLGSPTALTTTETQKAWQVILNDCPSVKNLGQTFGFFSTALAKTQVLSWLATHTDKVDGVLETSAMSQGVLQAFQQSGRPIPVIGQGQASKSVSAYWWDNRNSGYKIAAPVAGANEWASQITTMALRVLAGQGPKVNYIPWRFVNFSEKGHAKLTNPNWTTDTSGSVELPKTFWWSKQDYDRIFNHPERAKGTGY
jgi:ribose transport system substrate-binding protein